jgi:threonine dehydratase
MTEKRPTVNGVIAAADRIAGQVTKTPLLPFDHLGRRTWIKAECLQQGGSFKLRGASNRLSLLTETERANGVVAFSSGNHAQGVALAARRLGIAAAIVMPADAQGERSRRRAAGPRSSSTTAGGEPRGDRRTARRGARRRARARSTMSASSKGRSVGVEIRTSSAMRPKC